MWLVGAYVHRPSLVLFAASTCLMNEIPAAIPCTIDSPNSPLSVAATEARNSDRHVGILLIAAPAKSRDLDGPEEQN
jgi:hypothetical protein